MYSLKIAFRNLKRSRLYTWINIIGLSVSITAAVFILLWVQDERSYDKFHYRIDDLYILFEHSVANGVENYSKYLPAPLARAVKAEIPEVEAAASVGFEWEIGYLEYEKSKIFTNFPDIIITDTTFFHVFKMEFLEGDIRHAFPDPYSLILTEEAVKILFGEETALGKTLKTNIGTDYHVTGVVKNFPSNASLQFRAIISFEQSNRKDRWNQWSNYTYVLLHPEADPKIVGEKTARVHESNNIDYETDFPYVLQSVADMHLYAPDGGETGIRNIRIFTFIAFSLLAMACINYINLITARARKRAKEIGMRKLVGSGRRRLFVQMMGETVLLLLFSIMLATILLYLLTPYYNALTGKSLAFSLFDPHVIKLYLFVFIFIVVVAGIYPAIFLSSFKYQEVLHIVKPERKGSFSFRKILIVVQFICSAALIFATIVFNRQYYYMQTKNPGYDRENIFAIDVINTQNVNKIYNVFKQDLSHQPEIVGITASWQHIMQTGNFANIEWDGKPQDASYMVAVICVDRDIFSVLNLKLIEGEGFTGMPSDNNAIFVNQDAVRRMNLSHPLNTTINIPGWGVTGKIMGVIEDFHFEHMSVPIEPAVILLSDNYGTIYVKTERGQAKQAIAAAQALWEEIEPEFPFNYSFMDDMFDKLYRSEIQTKNLFNVFAVIAIFISCLGLFGLVTFTAETKHKEIGIRKVLGASVGDIVAMLSKEFLILVGIAMLIAFPLSYYWLNEMLNDYAYRINISWWMFAAALLLTLILTLLTVSFQAIKAATNNPVNAIKSD